MRFVAVAAAVLLLAGAGCGSPEPPPEVRAPKGDRYSAPRAAMVEVLRRAGVTDPKVLDAMGRVPRHRFVPADQVRWAYVDTPLLIGEGQTISAPHMVGLMTQMLELTGKEKVLEIGTGSGYQAAVLSGLVAQVYSIEIRESLARTAAKRLADLGYGNVTVLAGDGYGGWPDPAVPPFDAIIVTAAPEEVPDALVRQLAPGGRMIVPLGSQKSYQVLTRIRKSADGTVTREEGVPVSFVPMVHESEK
jgi:protein-L-isoaspartate(D-aspartate) O-methyltransferase